MKRTIVVCLLPILALSVSAQENQAKLDRVVIKVGEIEVMETEFEAALASIPAEYQAYVQQEGKRAFADDLIRMKLLAHKAGAEGLANDPVVAARLQLARDNTMASAMITRLQASIEPSDEQIAARYEASKGDYEQVMARHILVAFEGSPAARESVLTEDEAKTRAEGIRERLIAGEDFASVAGETSDDLASGQNGGALGPFSRGDMVPEFENVVFAAPVGEIAEVVRTMFGYHVIEVTERGFVPIEELRETLTTELTNELMDEAIDAMSEGVEVTFDDEYFAHDSQWSPQQAVPDPLEEGSDGGPS